MKLLFDQNLSSRLVRSLGDLYPGSIHVRDVGLHSAADEAVWNYAAKHGLTIISKDSDFHQRSFLAGHPPKVIWLRCGNRTTLEIEAILRRHAVALEAFDRDTEASFLVLE